MGQHLTRKRQRCPPNRGNPNPTGPQEEVSVDGVRLGPALTPVDWDTDRLNDVNLDRVLLQEAREPEP